VVRSLKVLVVCGITAVAAMGAGRALGDDSSTGRIGPALSTTANGRHLEPAGRLTTVGNFPTGSALSPDGRFMWVVDAGHGIDDVQIIHVADGAVVQKLPLPGGYVGVAFSPDGSRVYVSGEPKRDVNSAVDKPGTSSGGDVVHVFSVDTSSGRATEGSPIPLPATTGGTAQQHAASGPISGTPGPGPSSKGLGWPIGLAVSPDGAKLVVALNQADQIAIVDTATRSSKLVKVGAYPYGVAVDPDGRRALVTNELDGTVSVVDLASGNVTATIAGLGGRAGDKESHPEGIVIDPQRPRAYVAVANRDLVAVLDTRALRVLKLVSVARGADLGVQPVAVSLTPDGETLYAADSGEDAVAQIALTSRSLPVGAPPTVPGGGPLPPGASPLRHGRSRFFYRVPTLHTLARYRVLARRARRTLHVRHGRRQAEARYRNTLASLRRRFLQPVAVRACGGPSLAKARRYVLRALHALAHRGTVKRRLLRRARRLLPHIRRCPAAARTRANAGSSIAAYTLVGRIPTAAYPADVQVTPSGDRLLWVAAKGLGAGPNPAYGSGSLANSNAAPYGTYVLDLLLGRVGVLERPDDADAVALTPYADAQARPANAPSGPPAGTALRPGGPIKHVFYVVRENRTYDQVLGSESRGDGDPKLELFDDNGVAGPTGGVTPNAHALARRFPLLDHLYADSEVSVDGHIITAGADGIDYVQKAVAASYSGRGRISEFGDYPITFPPNDFIFDQAARQNVTFRNYGESSVGNQPGGNDGRPTFAAVGANTQYAYPFVFGCAGSPVPAPAPPSLRCNTDSGQTPPNPATSRFDFFRSQFTGANDATWPAFTYLTLPNDHTNGTKAGLPTPRTLVANDRGLGQLVDLISHSSIWQSSAIFVIEDDSQDGADHVDAHRMPAFVISPWARTGAVVHTAYDQNSALRTAEILLGLKPLSFLDATATPMYDAFTRDGTHDDSPYNAITPTVPLTETNGAKAPDVALSSALPFDHLDVVPQALSDRILWHSVHGEGSSPPPPGPNASPAERGRAVDALRLYQRRANIRKFLLHDER